MMNNQTSKEFSLHSLWIAYVVVPPIALGIITYAWIGLWKKHYVAGLYWALGLILMTFIPFFLFWFRIMGKRFVFNSERLDIFRFNRQLNTIKKSDIKAVFSIGNKDGFMIETKDDKKLRIFLPSLSLRKQFKEELDILMNNEERQSAYGIQPRENGGVLHGKNKTE